MAETHQSWETLYPARLETNPDNSTYERGLELDMQLPPLGPLAALCLSVLQVQLPGSCSAFLSSLQQAMASLHYSRPLLCLVTASPSLAARCPVVAVQVSFRILCFGHAKLFRFGVLQVHSTHILQAWQGTMEGVLGRRGRTKAMEELRGRGAKSIRPGELVGRNKSGNKFPGINSHRVQRLLNFVFNDHNTQGTGTTRGCFTRRVLPVSS